MSEIFIHPSSFVDEDAMIGEGTKIWHFCHVMSSARIGSHCSLGQNVFVGPHVIIGDGVKIQNNVSLYDGVILEDEVFCGPSVVFTNVRTPRAAVPRNTTEHFEKTLVKRGASIGANATIRCGVTLGEYSFIGAGSVVLRDVLPYSIKIGNPARHSGWACQCGERLPLSKSALSEQASCALCGKTFLLQNQQITLLP
jgi:UDP-2-acetamido-3-amino-2,3-dideoxy-glucuronate N-acetyltransferase